MKIAINVIELLNGSTLADITCIEELSQSLVLIGDNEDYSAITIPMRVFSALWWIFEEKLRDITVAQRRGALDILRMAGAAKQSTILAKMNCIVAIGFGPIAKGDAGMSRSACMALSVVFNGTNDSVDVDTN